MKAERMDLFPTRIWLFDCSELLPECEGWARELTSLRAHGQAAYGRSTRRGWSGPKDLFKNPAFAALQARCREAFALALGEMGVPAQARWGLEAWANILDSGGFNERHTHNNVMLSGAFYVAAPPGSAALVLHDPRTGANYSNAWGKGVNSPSRATFTPRAGSLVLFPSWLDHSVALHEVEEARLAIAINALPGTARPTDQAVS